MELIPVNIAKGYTLQRMKISELLGNHKTFLINYRRQRKYLFIDIPKTAGAVWQKKLFLSLTLGNPLPLFELTKVGSKYYVEDGQQRYKTILAILSDCVKLPKEISKFGPDYVGLAGKWFSDLDQEMRDRILNTELLFLVSENISEESAHSRFILINNGTPLTKQDKRSAQFSDGAAYLQSLVDGEYSDDSTNAKLKYKMFQISTDNKGSIHTYINAKPTGRNLEEVLAHWFNTIVNDKTMELTQPTLDTLYDTFKTDTIWVGKKSKFEKYLKELDKAIREYNIRKKVSGRAFTYSFYVLKKFMDAGYKVESDKFFPMFLTAIAKLKKLKGPAALWYDNKRKLEFTIQDLLRSTSDAHHLVYVSDRIFDAMITDNKVTIVDSKRTFSYDDKLIKFEEQDGKCGYCGDAITMEKAVCDHRVPYAEGGLTELDNLVVSCRRCNADKSALKYEEWERVLESRKELMNEEA